MSDETQKDLHSKRRYDTEVKSKRQAKIAKQIGMPDAPAHYYAKHHAVNCGNPKCLMCMNPRKSFGERTIQEQRFYQEIDE